MKVGVYLNRTKSSTVSEHMRSVARGLAKHGIFVEYFEKEPPSNVSACAVWGWRKGVDCRDRGFDGPILVVERGFIGDRLNTWTSLGWDGLNGRARFNEVWDEERFEKHFAADLRPWRKEKGSVALILGQVLGDMSLAGIDILRWYKDTATTLWKSGWDIRFRPHPESIRKGHQQPHVPFAETTSGSLAEDLSAASLAVAWNSNSLVDAVMAGVPIYAGDPGSMVYGLTSNGFHPVMPPREKRLNEIANVQWRMTEISDGTAWDKIRTVM